MTINLSFIGGKDMFGYVKKKEYDELYSYYKATLKHIKGYQRLLEEQEKHTELEYKRAEYWKAKALYPNSEPYVEGDMKTVKYIKS